MQRNFHGEAANNYHHNVCVPAHLADTVGERKRTQLQDYDVGSNSMGYHEQVKQQLLQGFLWSLHPQHAPFPAANISHSNLSPRQDLGWRYAAARTLLKNRVP